MASAAAHPMHGQWTWQNTPTGPGAALEDSAPTYVFIKTDTNRALTVRLRSGGPRIHSSRHGAHRIFDEKNPALLLSSNKCSQNPPQNKRFSANPQGDGNRNRDTGLRSQKNTLKNLKTKYERRNNKAIMHQSFSRRFDLERAKK